jgi:hypothetical protein
VDKDSIKPHKTMDRQGPSGDAQYDRGHHAGATAEARIAHRLKPSAGSPDTKSTQVTTGSGPTRTVHTVHHFGQQHEHGKPAERGADISGGKR